MFEFEKIVLETFIEKQEKLLLRKEFETLEDADEFLADCMAMVVENVDEVRDYLEEAGMDVYGMTDDELLDQAEVFSIPDGRFLIVEG